MVPELSRRRFIAGCGIAGSTALAAGATAMGTSNDSTDGGAAPPPTTRWNTTYQTGTNDQIHAVAQAPDDGYVLAGETTPSEDDDAREAWLFKVGPTGTTQWEQTFSERLVTVAKGLEPVDGGYVLAGFTNDGSTSEQSGLVIRVDGQGTEQWREVVNKDPDTATTDRFDAVDVDADGNFVFAGRSSRLDSGWIVRMDPARNVLLDHVAQEGRRNHFYGVVANSDGNYVAVGQTDTSEGPLGGWAYNFDDQGNTRWSETFYRGSGPTADSYNLFYDLTEISDGYVAVGANAGGPNASERRGWIIKIGNFGGRQWTTHVTDRPFTEFRSVAAAGLEFFAAGFTSEDMGTESRDGFISRFIATGDQDWAARYQGAGASTFTALTRSDDGGLYSFGRTGSISGGPYTGWGVKAGGTALSTPTQTPSPTPTDTPTPSPTPTPTETPTPTPTQTPSPTPTDTPTPSDTPSPTPSPTATERPPDPTPTATEPPTDPPGGSTPTATATATQTDSTGPVTPGPDGTETDDGGGGGGGGISPTVLGVGAAIVALGAGGLLYNRFVRGEGDGAGGQPPGDGPGGQGGQGGQPPQGGQGGQPPQGGQGGQPPQGGQGGQPPQGGQGGQPPQGGQGGQPPQGGQGGQPPQGGQGGQPLQGGQGGQPPEGGAGSQPPEGDTPGGPGGSEAGGEGGQPADDTAGPDEPADADSGSDGADDADSNDETTE